MEKVKTCPYCGEEIMAAAKKCKHCGEWLESQTEPEISPSVAKHGGNKLRWIISGAVVVAVVALFIIIMSRTSDVNSSGNGSSQISQWVETEVNGLPAIQATFRNSAIGILEVTYCPQIGFRFGLFDNNYSPKYIDGALICYQKNDDEFPLILIHPQRTGNYIFYSYVAGLVRTLKEGNINNWVLQRITESGGRDDSYDYKWSIELAPGEFQEICNRFHI